MSDVNFRDRRILGWGVLVNISTKMKIIQNCEASKHLCCSITVN